MDCIQVLERDRALALMRLWNPFLRATRMRDRWVTPLSDQAADPHQEFLDASGLLPVSPKQPREALIPRGAANM